ncbi:4,6-dehydratase [Musa troglodytarum]|uniref:4,6-dehydratase n=1 Tax=Musa troglodytarum TaxID=320322 RepID=A0A9E7JLV3_9LILI|nr:4,6-dehydratase [Musa troglodytarum]
MWSINVLPFGTVCLTFCELSNTTHCFRSSRPARNLDADSLILQRMKHRLFAIRGIRCPRGGATEHCGDEEPLDIRHRGSVSGTGMEAAIFGSSCRLSRAGTVAVRSPPERSHRLFYAPMAVAVARSESGGGGSRLFVFGTGFVGRYVSDRFISQGWHVSGTCTSAPMKTELEKIGMEAFVFDAVSDQLRSLHTLQRATHLLVSIPPIVGIGDPLLCLHGELQATIGDGNLQWLGYLSSTSVYGDCGGAWVDEDYPPNPKTESTKSRLAAEKGWLDLGHELGVAVNMFRLGGIYGPGRRRIYNVVDDDPAPRQEVFAFAQSLLEERWTGIVCKLDNNDMKPHKSRAGCEKRVSNARLKKELGVSLMYPTYRLGLRNILESWDSVPKEP